MKYNLMLLLIVSISVPAFSQQDSIVLSEPQTLDLQFLISEAVMNNPDIQADLYQMDVMEAKIPQAGALDDPELQYTREGMPGFRYDEAMFSRIELMQMFRFPTKLSAESDLAKIRAEHAHHDHLEKINEVVLKLKSAYYELWMVQQSTVLESENLRLMKQFAQIAGSKNATGQATQQEVLKAQLETAMINNELLTLHQQEKSAKAMLMAILNRGDKDTLGFAVIPDEVIFTASLDTLEQLALSIRPMLVHDSLMVQEGRTMRSLAKQEYFPDFKLGIERMTSPLDGFSGWSVRAGITLPFAPWTLGKASGRTEEADAEIHRATAAFSASRNMVLSTIKQKYYTIISMKQQLDSYRLLIVPQARQSLSASMSAYSTGSTNFLMLIDAYRTVVSMTKEYFMTRMKFEQAIAELELQVGYQNVAALQ